jgi:hypothetical protein
MQKSNNNAPFQVDFFEVGMGRSPFLKIEAEKRTHEITRCLKPRAMAAMRQKRPFMNANSPGHAPSSRGYAGNELPCPATNTESLKL